MLNLLLDTCVWLELAKDPHQQAALSALEDLCEQGEVSLLVPRIVVEEFARNKERVAQESGRSLSGIFKRVKDAVEKFGHGAERDIALQQLNDVDHRIPLMGQAAYSSIFRIEKLFQTYAVLETSDDVKLRAAQRAIDRKAPFHRQRNGMDDAVIIEIYSDHVSQPGKRGQRFAFVTHNAKDFSHPTGSDLVPHPDIAHLFSRIRSLYATSLVKVLQRIKPEAVSEAMFFAEMRDSPRMLSEILSESERLTDWIWYNRHWVWIERIEAGEHKIVPDSEWTLEKSASTTTRNIWEGARRAARAVEKKYGRKNLGPWSDFDWGMLNGKLSALRWVLGDDWDMLDT